MTSIGQVVDSIFRWDGYIEDFTQEDSYHHPEVVKSEFQATQNQLAWVASRGHETSHHLASVEWELKHLWVAFRLEQKYTRHLIKEHLAPLQCSISSSSCQCPIVGNFRQSPIPASFEELHRSCLDMPVLLPSSPVLPETPLSLSGKNSMPLLGQRCRLSSKRVACHMKLKFQMQKLLKKHGRTLVKDMLGEVAAEERTFHDVLGCGDCYIDPYSGHVSYCPLSVSNPFHPSHICLGGVPCSCDSYLADHKLS